MSDKIFDDFAPCIDEEGLWLSSASKAVKQTLQAGNLEDAMHFLKSANAYELGKILNENGFGSPVGVSEDNREKLLYEIQFDIGQACLYKVDGFDLDKIRRAKNLHVLPMQKRSLAELAMNGQQSGVENVHYADFLTSKNAAQNIQKILKQPHIDIELLGGESMLGRDAILFIAGQALASGNQGFSFEGFEGKFTVPEVDLHDMIELHGAASRAYAVECTRFALGEWIDGKVPGRLPEVIPDSIAQVFRAGLNLKSTMTVINAIQNGSIGEHAYKLGRHQYGQIMRELGVDIDADTVQKQAQKLGLNISIADTQKGEYVGPVAGYDHKSLLIKYAREKAIIVGKHDANVPGNVKKGDELRVRYRDGKVNCQVAGKSAAVER